MDIEGMADSMSHQAILSTSEQISPFPLPAARFPVVNT